MNKKNLFSVNSQLNSRKDGTYWAKAKVVENKKCVFCDLREKYIIKSNKYGVLTVNLFPYIDGQLMVIPHKHIEAFVELKKDEVLGLQQLVKQGVKLLNKRLKIDNIWLILRDGNVAGKTVKHLHWNIMPYTERLLTWNYDAIELTIKPLDLAIKLKEAT